MPALVLIIGGSVCIILTANFSEHVFSIAVHKQNLSDIRSVCFFASVGILVYSTLCILRRMRRSLATFERDADLWLINKKNSDERTTD